MKDTLGVKIKTLRKQRKMTLKDVANKTGFSISFISQLERGKSSATLESLKKISLALQVKPSYFFDEEEGNEKITRGTELEKQKMEKHNIFYKSLCSSMKEPAFSPLLVVLKPNQNEGNLFQHAGQEFLYVLEGKLTVQLEDETFTLHPSDSIMFDSNKLHYWYNYTDNDVKFLCVAYDEEE